MNRKVDFVVAGTQKSGTTALDAYLRLHPEVGMANLKEVHFFDDETVFARQPVDYSLYHNAFSPSARHKIRGECTPIYMYWHNAMERIWQYNPAMKIIIILRNPIERAFSHWNMERSRNAEPLSFWDAICNERDRLQEALPFQHRVFSYIDRGMYVEQLQKILDLFPKHNVLVFKHEALKENPQKVLAEVFNFLGVSPLLIENKTVFSIPYGCGMTSQERGFLFDVFKNEITDIEQLLGWDCRDWTR